MSFFADFFGNGGTPPPYQPPQLPQRFLQPSPVPEMQIRDVQQGLLSDKQGWDTSNKAMNLLTKQLETPDLTDEQKQKLNNDIADWQQQRDAFAASANDRRAQANALGIDVSDYGSDKTLRDASQAYNTYRNAAIRDFLNLPTVAQLEENRYRELRSNGASLGQAHRIINREHNLRQEDFLRKAAEGIMTYGTNPDGSLNEIGLQLTQRMNPSDPQIAASLFANGFAMPKDIFKEDRANNRARLAAEAQSGLLGQRLAAQAELARLQEEAKRQNLELTLQNKTDIENAKEAGRNARAAAQLNQNSPAGQFASYYELGLQIYGGDEKQALQYAYRQTSKWDPDKPEKVSAAQGVFNLFDTMFSYIAQGDEDSAGHLLEKVITNQNDKAEEFGAEFTKEENQKIDAFRSAFIDYLKLEPTSTDPKEINKQKAAALKTLMAKYRAINRGTNWTDEFAALSQSNFNARRNGKENPATGYDDYDQANKRVRELLGDNNGNKTLIPFTPPPAAAATGTGHFGSYVPQVRYP